MAVHPWLDLRLRPPYGHALQAFRPLPLRSAAARARSAQRGRSEWPRGTRPPPGDLPAPPRVSCVSASPGLLLGILAPNVIPNLLVFAYRGTRAPRMWSR